MAWFSFNETGSRLFSSILDHLLKPPEAPINNASTSLKFRPARTVTKARFKNDMAIGDRKLEEGMVLLACNEYLVSKKEMDVLLLSRDKYVYSSVISIPLTLDSSYDCSRIQKRKIAIMEACNANFISPKVHISPFIYNSKASQWYRQIEVGPAVFMSYEILPELRARNSSTDKKYKSHLLTRMRSPMRVMLRSGVVLSRLLMIVNTRRLGLF